MKTVIDINTSGLDAQFIEGDPGTVFTGKADNVNCQLDVQVVPVPEGNPVPFEILPKEIPFRVFARVGSGEFSCHRLALSWQHNNYFSPTCGTCQAGVGKMMGIVDYLDNRTMVSRSQAITTLDGSVPPAFDVGFSLKINQPQHFRFILLSSLENWQDLLDWISTIMASSIEGAHIKTLELRVEGQDQVLQKEGTSF